MAFSLQLTSLSSHALDQTRESYDVTFDLSSKPLPAFSAIECWRGRSISPLRDRVMVEWLYSHYEAEYLFDLMITEINKAILLKTSKSIASDTLSPQNEKRQEETLSTSLLVAVACPNGAQHSVCFVEKMYEKYADESHLELEAADIKLTVKREHRVATKGEWLDVKHVVWQHSMFSVKHMLNHNCKYTAVNRAWSNFPLDSCMMIEEGYLRDPLGTNLDIGNHIIDFERGVVLNKRSQEEFRIRSAIPMLDEKVQSAWLEDSEYRALHKSYTSAGILFYSVHPRTGEAVFLLGHMTYGSMSWCDFGGLRSYGEKARYTAARECYEETLGIFGKTKHLAATLAEYEENNVFKIVNRDTKYVGHFVRVLYRDYPAQFRERVLAVGIESVEVDSIRWFSLSSLRSGIQKALLNQYDLKVSPLKEDDGIDCCHEPVPLRYEFVHSLCIADQLGVLESIKHIAATHHEMNRPPPPPYISIPRPRHHSKYDHTPKEKTNVESVSLLSNGVTVGGEELMDNLSLKETVLDEEDPIGDEGQNDLTFDCNYFSDHKHDKQTSSPWPVGVMNSISGLQHNGLYTVSSTAAAHANSSESSTDQDGLRRRRVKWTPVSSPSEIGDSRNTRTEALTPTATDSTHKNFGIGAGTFLY